MNTSRLFRIFTLLVAFAYSPISTAQETNPSAFASVTLDIKIYRVLNEPSFEEESFAVWFLTMASNSFVFSEKVLDDNLSLNAEKFCGGGEWKPIHKKLQSGYLEVAFSCLDERASPYKQAAIEQGLPTIKPSNFLN
ncbi:hypothetical protein [Thalassospira tepidiphila]|uniref:hypothetical protein n=1 Tax=Thalassospira tepidiphila TaxID=393657 RepID=UPI0029235A2B|nr:hypothetical protein MACH01_02900 [Thalassospira tepidiphila]